MFKDSTNKTTLRQEFLLCLSVAEEGEVGWSFFRVMQKADKVSPSVSLKTGMHRRS